MGGKHNYQDIFSSGSQVPLVRALGGHEHFTGGQRHIVMIVFLFQMIGLEIPVSGEASLI